MGGAVHEGRVVVDGQIAHHVAQEEGVDESVTTEDHLDRDWQDEANHGVNPVIVLVLELDNRISEEVGVIVESLLARDVGMFFAVDLW